MNLGEKLARLREEFDISQKELAAQLNVGRSTISAYEKGTAQPSYDVLIRLAEFYGVNLDYLFGRTKIKASMKQIEDKLKTRSGMVPVDLLFRLHDIDKEAVGMLLYSYSIKEEYRQK
ncbi:MAG: helix-turn-helix transcriptional regulator [Clostridiales bacterium]|nr:helix-turn-helix transcriptional regulator [Clostridiales bacterium]